MEKDIDLVSRVIPKPKLIFKDSTTYHNPFGILQFGPNIPVDSPVTFDIWAIQEQFNSYDEATTAMDKWERIVMNVNFPFKFNVVVMSENVQKYRDELDGQRGYLQFQISREMQATNPNQMTIENLQRQMAIIQTRMDRVASGERPLKTLIYIESTSVGVSEREAQDTLSNQLNQLQTVFNAFDLSIVRVTGREVYYLSQMNYRIPNETELRKIFQEQK